MRQKMGIKPMRAGAPRAKTRQSQPGPSNLPGIGINPGVQLLNDQIRLGQREYSTSHASRPPITPTVSSPAAQLDVNSLITSPQEPVQSNHSAIIDTTSNTTERQASIPIRSHVNTDPVHSNNPNSVDVGSSVPAQQFTRKDEDAPQLCVEPAFEDQFAPEMQQNEVSVSLDNNCSVIADTTNNLDAQEPNVSAIQKQPNSPESPEPEEHSRTTIPHEQDNSIFINDESLAFFPPGLRVIVGTLRMEAESECLQLKKLMEETNKTHQKNIYERRIRGVKLRASRAELKAVTDYNYNSILQSQEPAPSTVNAGLADVILETNQSIVTEPEPVQLSVQPDESPEMLIIEDVPDSEIMIIDETVLDEPSISTPEPDQTIKPEIALPVQPIDAHVIPPVVMPIRIQPPVQPLNTRSLSAKRAQTPPKPTDVGKKRKFAARSGSVPPNSEAHIPETLLRPSEAQPSGQAYIAETPLNSRSVYSNIHDDSSYSCRDLIHVQKPKRLTASQRDIIQSIYRTGNYSRVSTLDRYLEIQLPVIPKSVFENIEPELKNYIVCIPRETAQEPAEIMKSNRHMFLNKSQEEILHLVHSKYTKTNAFKCYTDSELYNGPWMDLLGIIGTEWVVYLFTFTRMLKQFNDSTVWLHLWGPDESLQAVKPRLELECPASVYAMHVVNSQFVSKTTVIYQRKNYKFQYKPSIEEDKDLHPLVLARVQKTRPKLEFLNPKSVTTEYTDFVPLTVVLQTIIHVLSRINLQKGAFGSMNNVKKMNHNLLCYLKRPRAHKVPIKFFVRGIKTTEISWLAKSMLSLADQQKLLLQLMFWTVTRVVNPLLVHFFYITERSGMPLTVYYYDRVSWSRIQAKEMQLHNLNQLTNASNEKGEPWRLVPKSDGSTRVIVNLKEKNKELEDVHTILQSLLLPLRDEYASAQNWLARVLQFRAKYTAQGWGSPGMPFYVVKFDISSCYESASLDKLKELLKKLLTNGESSYLTTSMLQFLAKQQKYAKHRDLAGEELTKLSETYYGKKAKGKSVVLTEKKSKIVSGSTVLSKINSLLDTLRLQVRHDVSVPFHNGIPQGSACSGELCDLLLNDLVKHEFGYTFCDQGLLVRYVDDFLFVSIDLQLATKVFDACNAGFKVYNLHCKPAKVVRSFGLDSVTKTKFLGVELDCDTLVPLSPRLPTFLGPTAFSKENTKAKIVQELNATTVVLKAYPRAGLEIPPKVVFETAFVFGRVLGRRIKMLTVLTAEPAETVYKKALDKYFLRYVPVKDQNAEMHNKIRSGFLRSTR